MFQDKRPTKDQEYVIMDRTPAMTLMNALMSMSNSSTHMCVSAPQDGTQARKLWRHDPSGNAGNSTLLFVFDYTVTSDDINDYTDEINAPHNWTRTNTAIDALMLDRFQPVRLDTVETQTPPTFTTAQHVIPIQVVESCLAGTSYDNFEGMRDVDQLLADMVADNVIPTTLGSLEYLATLLPVEKIGTNKIIFTSSYNATCMYTKIFKHADRTTVIHATNVMNTWLRANYLLSPTSRMGLKHDLEFVHNLSNSPYVPRPRYSADENVQLPDQTKQLVATAKYINSNVR